MMIETEINLEKLTKYMCTKTNCEFIGAEQASQEQENPEKVEMPFVEKQIRMQADPYADMMHKCKTTLASVEMCNDPLFWSIYLAMFGRKEYERVGHETKVGREEMKEKSKMSEHFYAKGAAHLSTLLQTRITKKTCSEMSTNILTEPKLSFMSLNVVCAFYECNVYVVDLEKNVYMCYILNDSEKYKTIVLYRTKRPPYYYIDTKEQVLSLDELPKKYMKITSYDKPLLAISHYKVADLVHFANQLHLDPEMKNKKELYDMIAIYCSS